MPRRRYFFYKPGMTTARGRARCWVPSYERGPPNQAKLYPAFGADDDHRKGHGAFACWNIGAEIWGPDVMAFIDAVLKGR